LIQRKKSKFYRRRAEWQNEHLIREGCGLISKEKED